MDDLHRHVLKAHDDGHASYAIAALHDIPQYDVLEILRRNDRKVDEEHVSAIRYIRHPSVRLAMEAVCLLSAGKSQGEVSRLLDLSATAVHRISVDLKEAAERAKGNIAKVDDRKPKVVKLRAEDVLAFGSEHYNMPIEAIRSNAFAGALRKVRHIIVLVITRNGLASQRELARLLNRGSQAAGYYLQTAAEKRYADSVSFAEEVDKFERILRETIGAK